MKGLWQSVSGEWGGDIDLNDGKLQQAYSNLQKSLKWINTIGLNGSNVESVKKDLQKARDTLSSDINFIPNGKNFQKYCILAARAEAQSFLVFCDILENHLGVKFYFCSSS